MDASSFGSGVKPFFAWWGQELRELMPGAVSRAESAAAKIIIGVEPDGLRLIQPMGSKQLGILPPEGTIPRPSMLAYLASLARNRRSPGTIGLRLPYSACFVRRIELPAVARRDFARLLAMDLERSTPFKSKDVLTAHEVDNSPAVKGLLKVRHFIVKRKPVDGLKQEVEALGFKVTRVECTEESGISSIPMNFLDSGGDLAAPATRTGAATKLLALSAAVLAATAAYLYVDRHEQALQNLKEQSSKLRASAQLQKDALAKSKASFAEIVNYQKLRAEAVSRVTVLEELTRLLPDSAWVTDLRIDGETVDISGLAVSAAALVPLLERSKYFVDATSTASLTFDPREDKERFAIRARIRPVASAATSTTIVEGAGSSRHAAAPERTP